MLKLRPVKEHDIEKVRQLEYKTLGVLYSISRDPIVFRYHIAHNSYFFIIRNKTKIGILRYTILNDKIYVDSFVILQPCRKLKYINIILKYLVTFKVPVIIFVHPSAASSMRILELQGFNYTSTVARPIVSSWLDNLDTPSSTSYMFVKS